MGRSSEKNSVVPLGGFFWRGSDGIYYERTRTRLDPERTRVFFCTWASDGCRIYLWSHHRPSIDGKTFVALNNYYAKDARSAYALFKRIPAADSKSFRVLDSGLSESSNGLSPNRSAGFAIDRRTVFYNGNIVQGAHPKSFVSLSNSFGRDALHVFYQHRVLRGADARRWRLVRGLYSQDDKTVFYQNRQIRAADPRRFVVMEENPCFAYDGSNLFCNGGVSSATLFINQLEDDRDNLVSLIRMLESGKWEKQRQIEHPPYSTRV